MTNEKIPFLYWGDFPDRTETGDGINIEPTSINIDVLVNKINELVVEINYLKKENCISLIIKL